MVLDESSAVPEYRPSDSANGTALDVNPGTWAGIASIQVTLENGTCTDVHKWKVVMGATDLSQPGREAEVFQIQRILKHERYDIGSERNNIALLELEQPVECSDYIQLGCVPDGSLAVPELKTCYKTAAGEAARAAEAKVRLIDVQLCNSSRWYGGAVHPQDLCAGYPRGGIDTCQHFHAWIRAHAGPGLAAPTPAPARSSPGTVRAVSLPKHILMGFLEKLQEMLELLKARSG
ncbi:hypothetical protein DUI87_33334 [Hirundo rustica rustica]|uniref:Peptidase S1 domain-containing protein n=1 Tax=Hirundo rustica rustica TaxID=333673 RepID=A0A3M0ILP2_HIRRU|nr:hypothetical protein DUI87_33334 [Hirundo rustica rustica]